MPPDEITIYETSLAASVHDIKGNDHDRRARQKVYGVVCSFIIPSASTQDAGCRMVDDGFLTPPRWFCIAGTFATGPCTTASSI
jgi:hypothetical protein